ncbi:ATP synthase subunit C [Methylopila jiangsuensis]|uniref:ATP synthase subunit C n=1 Tax=Methylopila jiangsuensis TaxID=586230 RepID=A0A9W6N360_9HYPH|nr:hydantoinase/oxoprolinase family protein [Methylopila jiangsuensis]MDR6286198.1 putative H4MPT-linked C1 transfer pathway protein [Methylopila jiangsuensis]GLK75958.1 ATP synthase subunit C [Methylopila jiangsuensis]
MSGVIGLDVGGAHLKLARLDGSGALVEVRIAACPLWRGLSELDAALDKVGAHAKEPEVAATMTGELADLWPDRASGVAAISESLVARFGADRLAIYAGARRFVRADAAADNALEVASANWRATAEAVAAQGGAGLLVDIGSTTSDLIPYGDGRVLATGATDAGRMAADELVYLGVARTPVMAIAPRLPFAGAWVTPMAEFFATSADVHRLTGDLDEAADLHPAADGGPKTAEGSARRLLRMVGADLTLDTGGAARRIADYLAEAQLRRLHDAALGLVTRSDIPAPQTIVGAGVGRFLAKRLAERLRLGYRHIGALFSDDPVLAALAADCAPAAAVARLYGETARNPDGRRQVSDL